MLLPGGLYEHGERVRRFAFEPPTGAIELATMTYQNEPMPRRITYVLCEALAHVGEQPPEFERVHTLSVGDRQFLVRRLAIHLGQDGGWHTVTCGHCQAEFDLFIEPSALPVKEAGDGYPFAELTIDVRRFRLHVPTGADQELVASIADPDEALRALVQSCLVEPAELAAAELSAADWQRIEGAMEEVSPEVVTQVESRCPECNGANSVEVDPYACLHGDGGGLLAEVHTLAMSYHWSEGQILELPRPRRQRYLALVDRSRGMTN